MFPIQSLSDTQFFHPDCFGVPGYVTPLTTILAVFNAIEYVIVIDVQLVEMMLSGVNIRTNGS
jgi:hypothetical protein